ncbi:MAG: GNAT family N-acetyltransferase [Tepidiformaceae bacterium]
MRGVRVATPADVEAVVAVVNAAYNKAESFFTDELRTDAVEVSELVGRGEFLVVDGAAGPAGAVHVQAEAQRGHFGMLAVAPSAQGAGLGRMLVDAAEAYCAERGCSEIHLEAVDARVELPRWYERLGYVAYGTVPYVRPEEQMKMPVCFVLMAKRLPVRAARDA